MNFLAYWQNIVTKIVRGDRHNEATAAATDPMARPLMALLAHLEEGGTGKAFDFSPTSRSPERSRSVVALTTLVLLIQLFFTPQAVDAQGATGSLVESVKQWIATAQNLAQNPLEDARAQFLVMEILTKLQSTGLLAEVDTTYLSGLQIDATPLAPNTTKVVVNLPASLGLALGIESSDGGIGGAYPATATLQQILDQRLSPDGDGHVIEHTYYVKVVEANGNALTTITVKTRSGQHYIIHMVGDDPSQATVISLSASGGDRAPVTSPSVPSAPTVAVAVESPIPPNPSGEALPALEMMIDPVDSLELGGVTFIIDKSLGPDEYELYEYEQPIARFEVNPSPMDTSPAEKVITTFHVGFYYAWMHENDDAFYAQRSTTDFPTWLEGWLSGNPEFSEFSIMARSSLSEHPTSANPRYLERVTVNRDTRMVVIFTNKRVVVSPLYSIQADVSKDSGGKSVAETLYLIIDAIDRVDWENQPHGVEEFYQWRKVKAALENLSLRAAALTGQDRLRRGDYDLLDTIRDNLNEIVNTVDQAPLLTFRRD